MNANRSGLELDGELKDKIANIASETKDVTFATLALRKAYENGDEKVVNVVLEILMETDPNLNFNMKHGMWTTGSKTPFELIQKSTSFTLDGVADKIRCPTLVLEAEKDDSFPGQPQKVFNALVLKRISYLQKKSISSGSMLLQ